MPQVPPTTTDKSGSRSVTQHLPLRRQHVSIMSMADEKHFKFSDYTTDLFSHSILHYWLNKITLCKGCAAVRKSNSLKKHGIYCLTIQDKSYPSLVASITSSEQETEESEANWI